MVLEFGYLTLRNFERCDLGYVTGSAAQERSLSEGVPFEGREGFLKARRFAVTYWAP